MIRNARFQEQDLVEYSFLPSPIRVSACLVKKFHFPEPVEKSINYSLAHNIESWIFSKKKTRDCYESFADKLSNVLKLGLNGTLDEEIKTIILAGRSFSEKLTIALHLPASYCLPRSGDKIDYQLLIQVLKDKGIHLSKLEYMNGMVKGTINPINLTINYPEIIHVFDCAYESEKPFDLVTTNAGHNTFGAVFPMRKLLQAFSPNRTAFLFADIKAGS